MKVYSAEIPRLNRSSNGVIGVIFFVTISNFKHIGDHFRHNLPFQMKKNTHKMLRIIQVTFQLSSGLTNTCCHDIAESGITAQKNQINVVCEN
jgi:hypothetical protein